MNIRSLAILFLVVGITYTGTSQALFSVNAGFALSKGAEGKSLPDDYWGKGGSAGYTFKESSYKPGLLLGLKVTSWRGHLAFVSFAVNYIWIQNLYKYSGSTYSIYGYTEKITGEVTAKSSHLNTQLNLNLNFLRKEAFDLYVALGLGTSFRLNTKLFGEVCYVRNSYPDAESTYCLKDDEIRWRNYAVFASGYFGLGSQFHFFSIPTDIEIAYIPGFFNIYELPNFRSNSFVFILSFQLFSSKKDSTPPGS